MSSNKGILAKGVVLNGKYTVTFFIKKGANAETYRVKDTDGKIYFLKLFNPAQSHHSAFDANGNLLEIEFLKKIQHENLVSYKDSGEVIVESKKFLYLVLNFIAGETLAERMLREPISTVYDIRQTLSGVLNGLQYLHSLSEPIIHNEITPQNIMLDLSGNTPQSKIIDFGYARSFLQSSKTYNSKGLNLNFIASECITAGIYSPQSDLFSVGAVMYQMLFGVPPWNVSITDYEKQMSGNAMMIEKLLKQREKPLLFPNISTKIADFDASILNIIEKSLHPDSEKRFRSATEFLQSLNGEMKTDDTVKTAENNPPKGKIPSKTRGNGFADIAGMQPLKEQLKNDVIDLINDPEGAKMYNIAMPNGMLLYGPPGCGKTFFAEKFAEETNFNYKYINPGELASIYIHGTQEKIQTLFNEARKNAPFIICLDEVSSIFPKREHAREHQVGEVDEFLTQLNNCGKDGVFVIATTNFPQNIDKAVLRAGRLEIKIYVPPPDNAARKALFEMYLKEIPTDFGIDYEKLSTLTENYMSSDIRSIVDTVARNCRKDRTRITMEKLETRINLQKPSVSLDDIKKHEKIRDEMMGIEPEIRKIGFQFGNNEN